MRTSNTLKVTLTAAVKRTVRRCTRTIAALAFWTGIVAPLAYLPLILVGARTENRFKLFLLLIAVNYVALLVGYPYQSSASGG